MTDAIETKPQSIATEGADSGKTSTVDTNEDLLARHSQLEQEKLKLFEEKENYKKAYLKEKEKREKGEDVDDEEKYRRIAREELANSRLAEIAIEQDSLIQKTLKENKELKLAYLNKSTTTPSPAMGSHSEAQAPRDTLVTQEQIEFFKKRGWSDSDIERYKTNLRRRV